MAVQLLIRNSSVLYDRPDPLRLGAAEIALNYNAADPGLFFADNTASPSTKLVKIGPTFIGSTAPNLTPAGYASLSKGEQWLDTASTSLLKVYSGSAWQLVNSVASVSSGKPSNPVNGQLHYDIALSALYIYLTSSGTWVAV